ncbi:hypothetical protein ACFW2D_10020 [Streptomyces sp. NPDC058914]|uniref:hypothetical protein n=1 Tax=Streptomyces sp. NPDC058914 TaxID=3346671 RepID=UPI00369C1FF5
MADSAEVPDGWRDEYENDPEYQRILAGMERPWWKRPVTLVGACVAVVAAVFSVSAGFGGDDTFTLRATQVVSRVATLATGGTCGSVQGKLREGVVVQVLDGDGSVIATGALGKGVPVVGENDNGFPHCELPIVIDGVPGEVPVYQIKVGTMNPFPVNQDEAHNTNVRMYAGY